MAAYSVSLCPRFIFVFSLHLPPSLSPLSLSLSLPLSLNSEGSYSDSYSSDDESNPRDQQLSNSNGFRDFCIKDINLASYGRKEIEIAEKGSFK